MTKLAAVVDVRDVIRTGDIAEINTSIDSALEVATADLEGRVRTAFNRNTGYDLFFVRDQQVALELYAYHWSLANGFVDSGETFTVEVASIMSDFSDGTAIDITEDCIVDYDKGTVSYIGGPLYSIRGGTRKLNGNLIKISYTSGFSSSEEVYTSVPEWLKQAAILKAIMHLDTIQSNIRNEDGAAYDMKNASSMYHSMTNAFIRYFPKHLKPAVRA